MEHNQELQKVTSNKSLEKYSPDALLKSVAKIEAITDALAVASDIDQYPNLARLRADYGQENIEDLIKLFLLDLRKNVNLKRTLQDHQVDNIASEILRKFCLLTLADVRVVFQMAKHGEFGDMFDSLDMPKVMSWFKWYFNKRSSMARDESIGTQFSDYNDPRSSQRMTQYFNKLEDNFNKTKRKNNK